MGQATSKAVIRSFPRRPPPVQPASITRIIPNSSTASLQNSNPKISNVADMAVKPVEDAGLSPSPLDETSEAHVATNVNKLLLDAKERPANYKAKSGNEFLSIVRTRKTRAAAEAANLKSRSSSSSSPSKDTTKLSTLQIETLLLAYHQSDRPVEEIAAQFNVTLDLVNSLGKFYNVPTVFQGGDSEILSIAGWRSTRKSVVQ